MTLADINQVKGGGHAFNLGFSSTTGVQIAMTRFSNLTYDESKQTAEIGSGSIWHEVYEHLAPFNVTVVGGRAPTVGVAGFTLGGGELFYLHMRSSQSHKDRYRTFL